MHIPYHIFLKVTWVSNVYGSSVLSFHETDEAINLKIFQTSNYIPNTLWYMAEGKVNYVLHTMSDT